MLNPIILAAGLGSRLRPGGLPKCLSVLPDGRTILRRQLDALESVLGIPEERVNIVVGYRAEDIAEAAPLGRLVHNERYDVTNTSKSLLRAFRAAPIGDVLWMNGDVVFDPLLLGRAVPLIDAGQSFVAVNTASVADEEVKYTVDTQGLIRDLAKTHHDPSTDWLGEAVGVNFLTQSDRTTTVAHLRAVGDQDYFERALELGIDAGDLRLRPLDITGILAVEVDTPSDLAAVSALTRAP